MKNKFCKQLFLIIGNCLILLVFWILAITVVLIDKNDTKYNFIIILGLSIITVLHILGGIYWMFQKVIIDELAIKIFFFKKVVNQFAWDEIESIEASKYMKYPVYTIRLYSGYTFHLDRRKSIKKAIEFYSKNKIQ